MSKVGERCRNHKPFHLAEILGPLRQQRLLLRRQIDLLLRIQYFAVKLPHFLPRLFPHGACPKSHGANLDRVDPSANKLFGSICSGNLPTTISTLPALPSMGTVRVTCA